MHADAGRVPAGGAPGPDALCEVKALMEQKEGVRPAAGRVEGRAADQDDSFRHGGDRARATRVTGAQARDPAPWRGGVVRAGEARLDVARLGVVLRRGDEAGEDIVGGERRVVVEEEQVLACPTGLREGAGARVAAAGDAQVLL